MTENEIMAKLKSIRGGRDRAVLAGFWLMMGSRQGVKTLGFAELRSLSGDSRALFHAISNGLLSHRLPQLSSRHTSELLHMLHADHGLPALH
ncbi:hypothetical protein C8E02_3385 [Vogesella indigofera]|jgi:hypothetical protein|uniref:Uncharacterized protein n=2 Tax=Vogesella indigofera TaxID=45465 RepID=A0A495B0D2_VOGIN|nr:hypothetical protein C8E02_3385 [Vogesella indigofera]